MSIPPDVITEMREADLAWPRPQKPVGPGRPRKKPLPRRAAAKRAFMNAALFVTQTGERVPVVRVLVTLPQATAERADAIAAQIGTSVSGLVCCLIDDLPDPAKVPPAPTRVPQTPAEGDEAVGEYRPLWLPTHLGGKLARLLTRLGWDIHRFVGNMIDTVPEPGLLVPDAKTFQGWEGGPPSPAGPGQASVG